MKEKNGYIPALRLNWLTKAFDPFLKLTIPERDIKKNLLLLAEIKNNDKVLDFGCGTGTLAIMLKEIYEDLTVSGVDIDPNVLDIAKLKAKNTGYEIFFDGYDGEILPYENESFDKIFSSLVFHHLKRNQKINALKEIFRVLKVGGEVFILDFGKPVNIFMRLIVFIPQLLDGLENTQDNVKGRLPGFMKEAGYKDVVETKKIMTIFGSISYYKAKKRK